MQDQKERVTLIRWVPLGGNEIGLHCTGNHPQFIRLSLDQVILRLASFNEPGEEEVKHTAEFLTKRLGYMVRFHGRETRPIANRGPASRLIPESTQNLVISSFTIHIDSSTVYPQWITPEDLFYFSNKVFTFADLEPHSLKELVEWNLKVFGPHPAFPFEIEAILDPIKGVWPRTIPALTAHLERVRIPDDPNAVITLDQTIRAGIFSMVEEVYMLDVVFYTNPQTLQQITANKYTSALPINLNKAMATFKNRRWSLEEFGRPSHEEMAQMIRLAAFVARTVSCPLEAVLERGRLFITSCFMDTCMERMRIVPYAALVFFNKRPATKRPRIDIEGPANANANDVPDPERAPDSDSGTYRGGHVMDSVSGIFYSNTVTNGEVLVSLDFDSYYPSIILEWEIFYALRGTNIDIRSIHYFRKQLTSLVELKRSKTVPFLVPSIKLVINAMYGSWGAHTSDVGSTLLAETVTGHGRELIQSAKETAELNHARVLMGHTDSLLIACPAARVDDICNFVNGKFSTIKLRPNQHYSMCWVINKTHHISIKQDGQLSVIAEVLTRAVSGMLCHRESHGLALIPPPATLADNALSDIAKHLHCPGLITLATPPAVQLLNISIAALLAFGWRTSHDQIESEKLNYAKDFARVLEQCRNLCQIETVRAAAWYHYFDKENTTVTEAAKKRGMNDSNFRVFLIDLWKNKNARYIPALRSNITHTYDIPNLEEPTAKDVDLIWWIQRVYRSFESYIKQTLATFNIEREVASTVLREFLRVCVGVTDIKLLQDRSIDRSYTVASERVDEFETTHSEIIQRLPNFARWLEWAFDDNTTDMIPLDINPPLYEAKVWQSMFESIKQELPHDENTFDIIGERFILRYNPNDLITGRTCQNRAHAQRAKQRLQDARVYPVLEEVYTNALFLYSTWLTSPV